MKKIISSVTACVIALSIMTSPVFASTNAISSTGANSKAAATDSNQQYLTYSNELLGFSLELPKSWEDKYVTVNAESYLSRSVQFKHKATFEEQNGTGSLFTISVYYIKDDDGSGDPYMGEVLAETYDYLYLLQYPQDVDSTGATANEWKKMESEVGSIVKTIKTFSASYDYPRLTYDAISEADANGLTDSMLYVVSEGVRRGSLAPADPLLMVNGAFTDAEVIINNGRSFIPISYVSKNLGVYVKYDEIAQTVSVMGRDINILMTVDKNEAKVNSKTVPLDAPPIIVVGTIYLPLRFLGENMGKTVGYLPAARSGNIGLAYNPVVWIDADMKISDGSVADATTYLKTELEKGLSYTKANYSTDEHFKGIDQIILQSTFDKIESDIQKTKYISQMGDYLMYQGTGTILVNTRTHDIYFYSAGNAFCRIYKADMNNVMVFGSCFFG